MPRPDLLRKYSSIVHGGIDRAPNRSMLRAVGFKDEDFQKTIVGCDKNSPVASWRWRA
jgi:dihydroxy-acid dehydratase